MRGGHKGVDDQFGGCKVAGESSHDEGKAGQCTLNLSWWEAYDLLVLSLLDCFLASAKAFRSVAVNLQAEHVFGYMMVDMPIYMRAGGCAGDTPSVSKSPCMTLPSFLFLLVFVYLLLSLTSIWLTPIYLNCHLRLTLGSARRVIKASGAVSACYSSRSAGSSSPALFLPLLLGSSCMEIEATSGYGCPTVPIHVYLSTS